MGTKFMMHTSTTDQPLKFIRVSILLCFLMPAIAWSQSGNANEAEEAESTDTRRTFAIKNRSQFACAEVGMDRTGGQTSHEINLAPRKIERCLLTKVGSRLHECVKYRFRKATVDDMGVVNIETDDGPVKFWFDEETRISSAGGSKVAEGTGKGTLTFTWPDSSQKYLCAAMK
jgi:hypothetical protein